MFRSMSGFKAESHDLTILVIEEFNEWKVLLYGPHGLIHGTRQFSESKAKEHALTVAREYVRDRQHEDAADMGELAWTPAAADDWLVYR